MKRLALLTALLAAVFAILPAPSMAQIEIPILTSPTPSPSPTPTATTSPKRSPQPNTSPSSSPSTGGSGGSGGSTGGTSSKRSTLDPAVAKSLTAFATREKSPARTTTRLLELIRRTHEGAGEPTLDEKRAAFGRFPVVGYVWYQDDYGAARYSPYYSFHEGNDLFAVNGTPVIAVDDGYIWKMGSFSKGGNAVWLMGDDGVRYYYGHMAGFAKGLQTGMRVKLGDLIGYVGATGNARGTYPHVHFEMNPGGRGTIDPKPILDRWLFSAESALIGKLRTLRIGDGGMFAAARWDLLVDMFAEPSAPIPALWAAGLGGSGGTLAFADLALWDLLGARDWDTLVGASGPPGASGPTRSIVFDPLAALDGAAHGDAGS